MRTRHMNNRITFFKLTGGQNEDGEVLTPEREDLYTCWCEVKQNSIKDFQRMVSVSRFEKTFYVRHTSKRMFDNSCLIDFQGEVYKITEIEIDYTHKDCDTVKAVRVD